MTNINKLVFEAILNNNPSDASSPDSSIGGSEAQPQIEFDKKKKQKNKKNLIEKLKEELK